MATEFFKTDDGIYHKIESDYDKDPLHPRKDFDNIGKMVFKKQSRYSLGDIQTDEFAEFFEDELKEIDSSLHNNVFLRDKLTEKQLFDLWAEKQFFVLYCSAKSTFILIPDISVSLILGKYPKTKLI